LSDPNTCKKGKNSLIPDGPSSKEEGLKPRRASPSNNHAGFHGIQGVNEQGAEEGNPLIGKEANKKAFGKIVLEAFKQTEVKEAV